MNLKKTTVILLALFFIAGCGGKNYSGDYVYLINTQKAYYVTETGAEIDPDSALGSGALFLGAMSSHKQNYRKAYKYELTKAILTLKQEGTTVDGKLILTNDKSLTEFIIKSGYIDNDKRLHLKLTYQPEATLGMSAGFLSMSGPLGNMLLNLDQVLSENDDLLFFQVSGAVNALGGLASEKIGKGTVNFITLGKKDREQVFRDQVQGYIADDLKVLEESLNKNNLKKAQMYKELILSLGGEIPKPAQETLAKLGKKQ